MPFWNNNIQTDVPELYAPIRSFKYDIPTDYASAVPPHPDPGVFLVEMVT